MKPNPLLETMPRLGDYWPGQGGIRVGEILGRDGHPDFSVILPINLGITFHRLAWGGYGHDEPGATSLWNGLANTHALIASHHDHPAAQAFTEMEIDGHRDFYLPAQMELGICWINAGEYFEKEWHWSSTQFSPHGAYAQDFANGNQLGGGKGYEARVRPVRRLLHSIID